MEPLTRSGALSRPRQTISTWASAAMAASASFSLVSSSAMRRLADMSSRAMRRMTKSAQTITVSTARTAPEMSGSSVIASMIPAPIPSPAKVPGLAAESGRLLPPERYS